jgi:class 3 adenylate cyclase
MSDELLTILITDVEGSTTLYSAKGDAEAQAVLAAIDELARQQVEAHGGRTVKSLGDGLMAVFSSPRKAVACALAVQTAVLDHGERQPDQRVRVRMGLHTGEASEVSGDIVGEAVAAAARISARARGGEVLGSEVVRQLCGSLSDVVFEARGRLALKGFPERWRLYRILRVEAARATPIRPSDRTPFVGREEEQTKLRRLMHEALAGRGSLVMIGGEPGVGKTRLTEEIGEQGQRLGLRLLTGHCYEREADLPFMPWVEMMERVAVEASPTVLREALGDSAAELARIVPELRRLLPDIPAPLELPADQQRRYTFNSILKYITRVSQLQPRLYVLEDLHWADESTLLLLEHLAERLPTIPVLILGTYRDPPIDVSAMLEETLARLVRQRRARLLSLRQLSHAEVATLLRALSGHPPPAAADGRDSRGDRGQRLLRRGGFPPPHGLGEAPRRPGAVSVEPHHRRPRRAGERSAGHRPPTGPSR